MTVRREDVESPPSLSRGCPVRSSSRPTDLGLTPHPDGRALGPKPRMTEVSKPTQESLEVLGVKGVDSLRVCNGPGDLRDDEH